MENYHNNDNQSKISFIGIFRSDFKTCGWLEQAC